MVPPGYSIEPYCPDLTASSRYQAIHAKKKIIAALSVKLKEKSQRENIPFHTSEVLRIFYSLLLETKASTFYFVKGTGKEP